MSYIGTAPTIGNFQVCDAISTVNGQASYTMLVSGVNATPQSANHMLVSLNGILQKAGSSFTVSGSTITFASNLVTGDVIDFIQILGNVLDLGVPSDSTVSLAKLTATGTKSSSTFLRGDNTFAEAGGGKINQVVQGFTSSAVTTTSSSYVTSGLTATITPTATSSKVLVNVNHFMNNGASNGEMICTIYRGSSNIITDGASNCYAQNFDSSGRQDTQGSFSFLDTPNTTSATTYTMYFLAQGGTAQVVGEGTTATIILYEVLA
jgi:hypothetical protein